MSKINVWDHVHKDFFRCAKDSVFGDNAYITGSTYANLQDVLNREIRKDPHLITWSPVAPEHVRELDVMSRKAFQRRNQRFLKLTPMGEGRLQLVLARHYRHMRIPS
tara:strand:- start:89 stop:409 length:321 start_codon:yes stop_codon:yes gene_type:complete